jgi:hypothetical protein
VGQRGVAHEAAEAATPRAAGTGERPSDIGIGRVLLAAPVNPVDGWRRGDDA